MRLEHPVSALDGHFINDGETVANVSSQLNNTKITLCLDLCSEIHTLIIS